MKEEQLYEKTSNNNKVLVSIDQKTNEKSYVIGNSNKSLTLFSANTSIISDAKELTITQALNEELLKLNRNLLEINPESKLIFEKN